MTARTPLLGNDRSYTGMRATSPTPSPPAHAAYLSGCAAHASSSPDSLSPATSGLKVSLRAMAYHLVHMQLVSQTLQHMHHSVCYLQGHKLPEVGRAGWE